MARRLRCFGLRALLGLSLIGAGLAAFAGEATVFAAASLKTAMDEIAADFQEDSGHRVAVSLAGSSVLARQIEYGAPADLFLSADRDWMDYLAARGRIDAGSRVDLLGNRLVLVAPGDFGTAVEVGPETPLAAMLGEGRLAMALVDSVPAGRYGKAALVSLGLWDSVEGRVVQVDNVRAALALVALGAASLGVVYATDVAADDRVTVGGTFPQGAHPEIVYPAALVAGRGNPAAVAFLAYLQGARAQAVFETQGFEFMPGKAP